MSVLFCISSEQFYVHWSLEHVSLFFPPVISSILWFYTWISFLCHLGYSPHKVPDFMSGHPPRRHLPSLSFLLEFSLALNFVACDPPQVGNISNSWDSLLHCNYQFLYFVYNWGFSFIQGKSILSHLRLLILFLLLLESMHTSMIRSTHSNQCLTKRYALKTSCSHQLAKFSPKITPYHIRDHLSLDLNWDSQEKLRGY